jgi:hypothetical protein
MGIEDDFRGVIEDAVMQAAEQAGEEAIIRAVESGRLGEAIAASASEIGASIADGLAARTPGLIAERRANEAGIAELIRQAYGAGLDLCESVLRSAHEIGEEYVDLSAPEGEDGVPVLRWVLGHLHARACRIAEEALILARAGYGLGAYSRWRALHEVVVVGEFIKQNGDDTATRYYAHMTVNRWQLLKAASESGRLDEYKQGALARAQQRVDELADVYGPEFIRDYGWAAQALSGQPNGGFRGIQAATDFTHLRVDYREASAAVHAVAVWVLEPPDAEHLGTTLATGASPLIIATPAHAVALSMLVSTGTLLTSSDSWAAPFLLSAISTLCDRAGDVLAGAEVEVERQSREERESEQE